MSSDADKRSNRIAGWCGVVFSVLSLAVIPIVVAPPTPPVVGAPGVDVALWFDSNRVGFLVGNYLGIVAFFFGFVQLAVLAARVRRAEGEGGWLALLC